MAKCHMGPGRTKPFGPGELCFPSWNGRHLTLWRKVALVGVRPSAVTTRMEFIRFAIKVASFIGPAFCLV